MTAKKMFKNTLALLLLTILGISAGQGAMYYACNILPLIESQETSAPPIGIILFPFLAFIFSITLTIIFASLLFGLKRTVKLSNILLLKKDEVLIKIIKVTAYLILLMLIFTAVKDLIQYRRFLLCGLWFYISITLFIITGTVIICSILTKEETEIVAKPEKRIEYEKSFKNVLKCSINIIIFAILLII